MSNNMSKRFRVAYLVSHPIQYQAPLLRYLTEQADVELTVFFMSDFSLQNYHDPGFGAEVSWDIPLLEGYRSEVLPAMGDGHRVSALHPFHTGLARRLTRDRFDALWMHGYAHLTNLRAMAIAKMRGIPVLLRAESQAGSAQRTRGTRQIKEAGLRLLLRQASAFLAIGSRNRAYYERYGVPPQRIFSMPYAVDNAFFQARVAEARERREAFRASLNLTPGRPIILFASKFIARKRAGDLLEAYRRLSQEGTREPEPYLLFIGEGEERATLEAKARETGWSSIRFLGFKNQTELPAYFDLCDVFVLASEREPWGLIVNEVMNAGKPVIVSEGVGSADDLVRNGENGYIVPVGDITALTNALRRITADPALQQRMGDCSKEIIDRWSFYEDRIGLEQALEAVVAPKGHPDSTNVRGSNNSVTNYKEEAPPS
jgi:glycosyltransferase involved in cell wall biosynthesis